MKHLCNVLLTMALLCCVASALDNVAVPADFYDGDNTRDRVTALEALTGGQTDTNAITLPAAYTPEYSGQALIGHLAWSNAVWLARSITAGDWQLVDVGASTTSTTSTTTTSTTTSTSTTAD
jgi:hypothetical protein